MKLSLYLTTLLLATTISLTAQQNTEALQQEINQMIWKPFAESYSQLDAKRFNSLHTNDVLRANSWNIRVGEEYLESNRKNFQRDIDRKVSRTIEFRFDERKVIAEVAYEVGYYKVITSLPDEEPRTFYGRFHVVIRKIDGQWKIAQDWDSDKVNGVLIGEEDFQKASPMK